MKNQQTAPESLYGELYRTHLASVCARADKALERADCDNLVVYSGAPPMQFLDDQAYPFKVNPHFKQWVPVLDNPGCLLVYQPGRRPRLLFNHPTDFWHKPAALPQAPWAEAFDIVPIPNLAAARAHLPDTLARTALIGELPLKFGQVNPQSLLDSLHYHRAFKTGYEVECLRHANHFGALGHRAAQASFLAGGSEFDAHLAYLQACNQREEELPYNSIVAIDTNAAVLHYQHLERSRSTQRRSFLIDAGANFNGYASDITRTCSAHEDDFAMLVSGMDQLQQDLCATLRPGADWADVQMDTHLRVGHLLREADLIRIDGEAAVAEGLTALFFPHGVGHLLGLQVHDAGGFLRDESGATIDKPPGQPFLRLTRRLESGFVVTVEPGLYFIDPLLEPVRQMALGRQINWNRVKALRPCGGIRIEDNVLITETGSENLTRQAFAALG